MSTDNLEWLRSEFGPFWDKVTIDGGMELNGTAAMVMRDRCRAVADELQQLRTAVHTEVNENIELRDRIAALEAAMLYKDEIIETHCMAPLIEGKCSALAERDRLLAELVAVADKLGTGVPIMLDSIIARAKALIASAS